MKRLTTIEKEIKAMGFKAFIRQNENDVILFVSAEEGDNAADFYGEINHGYSWINPRLIKLAEQNGAFWDWQNPGCIYLNR